MKRARLPLLFAAVVVAGLVAATASPAQAPDAGCPRGALPAYAHNDYVNPRPLDDALSLGYQGVEADVFLVGGVLRLGHDRKAAARGRALEATYLAPLRELVARCGTLTASGHPFLLDVELKEASRAAFDTLVAVLGRYPELFAPRGDTTNSESHDAPAIEVVLVGWDAPALAERGPVPLWRQIALRRPDGRADGAADPTVRLISVDYHDAMGRWWTTGAQRRRWLASLRAVSAAYPGVRMRAFHVPVDARVYRALFDAGVDLIGTQDVVGTARVLAAADAFPDSSSPGDHEHGASASPANGAWGGSACAVRAPLESCTQAYGSTSTGSVLASRSGVMSEFVGTEGIGSTLPTPRDGDAWAAHVERLRRAIAAVATAQAFVARSRVGQALRQAERRRPLERFADRPSPADVDQEAHAVTAHDVASGPVAELARAREQLRDAVTAFAHAHRRASEAPERMLVHLKSALGESFAIAVLPRDDGAADVREEIVRWAIDAYYSSVR